MVGSENPNLLRKRIVDIAFLSGKGHIGSALSVIDLVDSSLSLIRGLGSEDERRDRFVLSKGHAALALYVALEKRGIISEVEIHGYCADGTKLGTHPFHGAPGVEFSTGSLGQGVTFAVGAALAGAVLKDERRVVCVMSDAELNEGCVWEAILFAAHHQLENLLIILDFNGQQALGKTSQVLNVMGVPNSVREIGWQVIYADGHSMQDLNSAYSKAFKGGKPTMVVAATVSGKGIPFMEGEIEWHYRPLTEKSLRHAHNALLHGSHA